MAAFGEAITTTKHCNNSNVVSLLNKAGRVAALTYTESTTSAKLYYYEDSTGNPRYFCQITSIGTWVNVTPSYYNITLCVWDNPSALSRSGIGSSSNWFAEDGTYVYKGPGMVGSTCPYGVGTYHGGNVGYPQPY